jgi:hypothetical protein
LVQAKARSIDPKQVGGFLHHSALPFDEVSRVLDLFLGESRSLPDLVAVLEAVRRGGYKKKAAYAAWF